MVKATRPTRTTKRKAQYTQGSAPWTTKKRSALCRETYPDDWAERKQRVKQRDGFKCVKCGISAVELKERGQYLEVDHIIRLADGGTNSLNNLQTLCPLHHKNRLNHRHMRIREKA